MSNVKSALKAAKTALDSRDFALATNEAKKVLEIDKGNYNARVFLGLAFEKQDLLADSEAAYRAATELKKDHVLAWQGLVSLYEKQHGERLDQYHDAALSLAQIYMNEDDRLKCQSVLDKYTLDAKKYGNRSQYKRSLDVILPSSPIFTFLEGRIPDPALTYTKMAEICEIEAKERINTEIGQRRTRLGAKIDQVTLEVRREVYTSSPLEELYQNIIDWTHDDDVRRTFEEKLLRHALETLAVLPLPQKTKKRKQVQHLAEGLVILKHPYLLAWTITIEWKDVLDIAELGLPLLEDFMTLFPEQGLSKLLKGFLGSKISPLETSEDVEPSSPNSEEGPPLGEEDRLMQMTEGLQESKTSILSRRLMGQYYIHLEEYESAAATTREGLRLLKSESLVSGLAFENTSDAIKCDLATALVHYQAPRHHTEAMSLFENVLQRKPANTAALIGTGLVYEEQENYRAAVTFLERALETSDIVKVRAEAAWCKALDGEWTTALHDLEDCLTQLEGSDMQAKKVRSQILYRIGMCMWNINTSSKARKDRKGAYSFFLSSLQSDLNFAPAYTILGVYYADYAKDKTRAKKCFLKAFELSISELDAAERLARILADSGSWEDVEAIAQRVVDSGKIRAAPGSKKRSLSWPYAALGVVQLNNQDYPNSIVSFQCALRVAPDDHHSWIGLGESYHNSGRYVAATRAFEHAEQVRSSNDRESTDDFWFSKYMLANVKRELGEYQEAIARYQEVMKLRPNEYGILMALLQCFVESAWHNIDLGFFGQAASHASEGIRVAFQVAKINATAMNLWKYVGDACSVLVHVPSYATSFPVPLVKELLLEHSSDDAFSTLSDLDEIGKEVMADLNFSDGSKSTDSQTCMRAAILSQKRSLHGSLLDIHSKAVAWYNLGWTEHLAYHSSSQGDASKEDPRALRFLRSAVQCFKRAIELEAGNAEFWNALGVATQKLSPKISQHSFIRSLFLNDKNSRVWTNLGGLYLLQNDLALANEAFTRAQSSDPDYADAWLGQGLIAAQTGDQTEARHLFTHAFEIADSACILIKQEYALAILDDLLSRRSHRSATDLLEPLLGLRQLSTQVPSNLPVRHLRALFSERVDERRDTLTTLESLCAQLESEYEVTESLDDLLKFAQAKSDLARSSLGERDFQASISHAETALDLTADLQDSSEGKCKKLRLSAHMSSGLAHTYLGSMDEAIEMFKVALNETSGDPDAVCLLAQVLWAKGGENERQVAREQLLDCIENHPGHVGATLLLGVVAVLDDDADILDVVTSDLESLRTQDTVTLKQKSQVASLLTDIASFRSGNEDDGDIDGRALLELKQATSSIMLAPSQPFGWCQLAAVSDDESIAQTAILTALKAGPPAGALEAAELADAFAGTGKIADAQRGVTYAPWNARAWNALVL